MARDDVFGIMENHGLGSASGRRLMGNQRIVQMIEAVRLRGRAVGADLHALDTRVVDASDGRRRRRVVPIMADEDAVIVIVQTLKCRPEHRCDDRRLVPRRHEDRDKARVLVEDVIARIGSPVSAVDCQSPPEAACEVDQVDEEVVDREQQEADAGE